MIPQDKIERAFSSSPPSQKRGQIHDHIRAGFKTLANDMNSVVPDCEEKKLAYDNLEMAMMWFNKGLANEDIEARMSSNGS